MKRQKLEELKRLKNLKKQEIEKKLKIIDESMGKSKVYLIREVRRRYLWIL